MAGKLRIGFIGAGFMGQLAHIRSYASLRDQCELVALAEPRRRTAELVAERYGIERVYGDHLELLDSEHIDGLVAVQRFTHHAALLPELYPRVPCVFTEKPLALGAAQGDHLVTLATEAKCVHMVGYHRRSDPATREAKRLVDGWRATGEMGTVRYLRLCYTDGDWVANSQALLIDEGEEPPEFPGEEPPPEFGDDEDASWALREGVDKLGHPLNLLRHFLGERYRVAFVHASGRLLVFEAESGTPLTIEVSPYRRTLGFDEELLVAFDRGFIRLRPAPSLARNRAGTLEMCRDPGFDSLPERIFPELPWVDPQQAQAADFLRVCRGEADPPTDAREAAMDLHLIADIVRARLDQPGGRESIRDERVEAMRAWEERVGAMKQ
jgi:predicted dehydrogenase